MLFDGSAERGESNMQYTLPGFGVSLDEKVSESIELLREHEPASSYYGCFSGGKDSVVIKHLATQAGVRVKWHYHVTTIDPPPLVRFIRSAHPDVVWDRPPTPFFKKALTRGFPTRVARWCCEEYKEGRPPKGSVLILGVRAAESHRRAKNWHDVTWHRRTRSFAVCPILRWKDQDVWEYIRTRGLEYCELYDQGFARLGCVGCPMSRQARRREFQLWPGFERQWKRLFQKIWEKRAGSLQRDGREWFGSARFDGWGEMWEWWVSDKKLPAPEPCQYDMFR
jgi:phosphoadenosine phosphosulfate reductase